MTTSEESSTWDEEEPSAHALREIVGRWDEEEPSAHALREIVVPHDPEFAGKRYWLRRVKNYKVEPGEVQASDGETTVKIPKVSWEVSNKKMYEPEAVSIGPYHYNKEPKLCDFQEVKVRFASTFVRERIGPIGSSSSVATVEKVYGKVSKVAGEARGYYSADVLGGMTDDEFADVMFLDGCFVLEFICRAPGMDFPKHLEMNLKLIRLVGRDLLLLDNQVPFIVLQALSSTSTNLRLSKSVFNFLKVCLFPGIRYGRFQKETKPVHLLDFLSSCLYDPRDRPPRIIPDDEWMTFPSVTRLEEAGIHCWPTESLRVSAIRFTPKLFTAELKIPPVFIGQQEHGMAIWMNLAAYQICAAAAAAAGGGGGADDQVRGIGAAEYTWMLDKLIDDAEDVRKLRAKQIILHDFESDQQLVTQLKEMSQNITNDTLGMNVELPMPRGKDRVLVVEIHNHLRSNYRRWLHKNVYSPYFRSAWSIPAFLAAIIGLVLTFLQVYYAIYPRH